MDGVITFYEQHRIFVTKSFVNRLFTLNRYTMKPILASLLVAGALFATDVQAQEPVKAVKKCRPVCTEIKAAPAVTVEVRVAPVVAVRPNIERIVVTEITPFAPSAPLAPTANEQKIDFSNIGKEMDLVQEEMSKPLAAPRTERFRIVRRS
jgi:hypothetical protein